MNFAPLFIIGACLLATATAVPFPGPNQPTAAPVAAPLLIQEQSQSTQDEQNLTPVSREKRENVIFGDSGIPASSPCRNCGVSRIEYTETSSPVRTCRTCGGGVSRVEYTEQPVSSVRTCRNCGETVSRIEYTQPRIEYTQPRIEYTQRRIEYTQPRIEYAQPVVSSVRTSSCRSGNCGVRTYTPEVYSYTSCRGGNCNYSSGGSAYYPVRTSYYPTQSGYTCRNCA